MGATATDTAHASNNTGVGASALAALTTGNMNVGIGYNSGYIYDGKELAQLHYDYMMEQED